MFQKVIDFCSVCVIIESTKGKQIQKEESKMTTYRIITEEGKEILKSNTYAGCENYYNACNGIYEDENGEHYIYIEEII